MRHRRARSQHHDFELDVTYEEIAAEMQITPQRVQQIERRAMRKLAERFTAKGYGKKE
jgi:DNA-directed RNA polymerase sigma subunit (sigma70/sigma32)